METESAFYRDKVVPATKLNGVTVMTSLLTVLVLDRNHQLCGVREMFAVCCRTAVQRSADSKAVFQ
jgi:hypothetical protein